jgi:hypothetical protein
MYICLFWWILRPLPLIYVNTKYILPKYPQSANNNMLLTSRIVFFNRALFEINSVFYICPLSCKPLSTCLLFIPLSKVKSVETGILSSPRERSHWFLLSAGAWSKASTFKVVPVGPSLWGPGSDAVHDFTWQSLLYCHNVTSPLGGGIVYLRL